MRLSELKEFDGLEYLKDERQSVITWPQRSRTAPPSDPGCTGHVATARGMTALARDSGVKREALYRALSESGNAEYATIMKLTLALGLHLTIAQTSRRRS